MSKENKPILKHLRSSSTATDGKHSKLPSLESFPSDAQDKYGIFAINYLKGQETITTLNSDDKVVPFNLNIVVDFSLSPTDQQEIDKTIFESVKNAKLVTINNVYVVNQKDVKDNKVYFNGILYDLQKIYDTFNNVPKIDKFGVFITLKYNPITRKNLDKFLYMWYNCCIFLKIMLLLEELWYYMLLRPSYLCWVVLELY